MSHAGKFYPVSNLAPSRLTTEPIKEGPGVLAKCGHIVYQHSHIMRGLGAKRVTPARFNPLYLFWMSSLPSWLTASFRPDKCTECECTEGLAMATVCAWCFGLIMPGERVCLYTHLSVYPDTDLETATQVMDQTGETFYVCCASLNCHAGYGGPIAGLWTGQGVQVTS